MVGTDEAARADDATGEGASPRAILAQAAVMLFGEGLTVVHLPAMQDAVVFGDLCRALGLDAAEEGHGIRGDAIMSDQLVAAQIEMAEGMCAVDVLLFEGMPYWLAGLPLDRLPESKRLIVRAFKREALYGLHRHFMDRRDLAYRDPLVLLPIDAAPKPAHPGQDAPRRALHEWHVAMTAWLEWQIQVDELMELLPKVRRLPAFVIGRMKRAKK